MRLSKMIAVVLTAAGAIAVAAAAGATAERTGVMPVSQLKAERGVQPGDCKATYSMVMGQNPAMAQQIWTATVAAQYGSKWAHWVGAKNKVIIPHGSGAGQQFEARAMPCFYQPVP